MTNTKECLCRQLVAVVVRKNLTPIMESKEAHPEQRDPPFPPSFFTIPPPSYSAIVYVRSPAAAMDIMGEKESERNL